MFDSYEYEANLRPELKFYFDFDDDSLKTNSTKVVEDRLPANPKQRRLIRFRDVELYSISFDFQLTQNNPFLTTTSPELKANLFTLNTFDESNQIFLFGLNLIRDSESQVRFELFTSKNSAISDVLKLNKGQPMLTLNLTFTFKQIELNIIQEPAFVFKLTDKYFNLFFRSLLKAYASFMLSVVSPLSDNSFSPETVSSCMSNFRLGTRKPLSNSTDSYKTYSLIERTRFLYVSEDFVSELVGKCKADLYLEDQRELSLRTNQSSNCLLINRIDVNTNRKVQNYFDCECPKGDLCDFWLSDGGEQRMNIENEVETVNPDVCGVAKDYACFNNGTCINHLKTSLEPFNLGFTCQCSEFYTGNR